MDVKSYVERFTNHPILFIGTGFSMRYIKNSFSWDKLLEHIAYELKRDENYYLDLKYNYQNYDQYNYPMIATSIEREFDKILMEEKPQKFNSINEKFYDYIRNKRV